MNSQQLSKQIHRIERELADDADLLDADIIREMERQIGALRRQLAAATPTPAKLAMFAEAVCS